MYDTIQHILTLSIDAIALCYSALIAADFVLKLVELWNTSKGYEKPSLGMCAETLAPIFEQAELDKKAASLRWSPPTAKCLAVAQNETLAIKEAQCQNQTSADILNVDTTPETVAIAATTRSTSSKQKKPRTLPTNGQKKQSSVKPSTKVAKKPKNASASGRGKNTPLKKIPNQIDIVSNDIPSFSNALSLVC